jgi:hypothetical protein
VYERKNPNQPIGPKTFRPKKTSRIPNIKIEAKANPKQSNSTRFEAKPTRFDIDCAK